MEALSELNRPWKLATLAMGITLLIGGRFYYQAPDWDVPFSLIMALVAYATASWSMHVMVERQWKNWPLMLVVTWFAVDGCYWLYWRWQDPVALEMMREANAPASLSGVDPISRTPYCSYRRSPKCPNRIPSSRRIRRNFVIR